MGINSPKIFQFTSPPWGILARVKKHFFKRILLRSCGILCTCSQKRFCGALSPSLTSRRSCDCDDSIIFDDFAALRPKPRGRDSCPLSLNAYPDTTLNFSRGTCRRHPLNDGTWPEILHSAKCLLFYQRQSGQEEVYRGKLGK